LNQIHSLPTPYPLRESKRRNQCEKEGKSERESMHVQERERERKIEGVRERKEGRKGMNFITVRQNTRE
jgi:hypothetical protein